MEFRLLHNSLLVLSLLLLVFAQATAQPPAATPNQPAPPQKLPPEFGLAKALEAQPPNEVVIGQEVLVQDERNPGKKFKIQIPPGLERKLPRGEMIQGFPRGG